MKNIKNTKLDLPARGNGNGLNSDDDDEDESEDSDELVTMSNMGKGSRLGGHQFPSTDSRSQSVLCMYLLHHNLSTH